MEIKKNLTTQNFNIGTINRIKFIVIHFTGNNGDTALANTNYFKSYRGASAHYFVDENSIYQSIEDKNIAWHCGANNYKHPYCRNSNSIGVELCSYKNSTGNFAFKPKTVDNAVWLVRELMARYNIPTTNVVRHYDVTGKLCPEPYVRDSKAWQNFKARLSIPSKENEEMVSEGKAIVNGKEYKIDRILKDNSNFIKASNFGNMGFKVGFNADTKAITIDNKTSNIIVNDKQVEAVNIDGFNYVKLRDLAEILGKDVQVVSGKIVIR